MFEYMAERQHLPADLGSMTPGAELAALLDRIEPSGVADDQVVGVLQAAWRQLAHAHARYFAALVEIGHREPTHDTPSPRTRPDDGWRALESAEWCCNEISAALTFTAHRADTEYQFAALLLHRLPQVWAALLAGQIDHLKARVFVDYLGDLTDQQIATICARLLPKAPRLTTGQLAHRLLREVLAIDPGYTRRRYRRGVRERGVWGYLAADGTAVLSGHGLPPADAAAAAERIEQLAAAIRAGGHPHTEQQLRADLFLRLLDGRFTGLTGPQIVDVMLAGPRDPEPGDPDPGDPDPGDPDPGGPDPGGPDPDSPDPNGPGPGGPADGSGRDPGPDDPDPGDPDSQPGPDTDQPDPGPNPSESWPNTPAATRPDEADGAAPPPGPATRDSRGRCTVGGGRRTRIAQGAARSTTGCSKTAPAANQPAGSDPPRPPDGSHRQGIEVRIGLSTLLGLDDHPAELPGWGPIAAEHARAVIARQRAAEWRFAIVDDHGYLVLGGLTRARPRPPRPPTPDIARGGVVEIHVRAELLRDLARCTDLPIDWAPLVADLARQYADRRRTLAQLDSCPRARYPGLGLRRHVQLRDRTCVAPGCRRPARKADQDHTRDHARGGLTVRANLEALCRRHHRMKHVGGWRLSQAEPGLFRWESPLGQVLWTRGEPIRPDLPDAVPGPAYRHDPADGGSSQDVHPIFTPPARRHEPPPRRAASEAPDEAPF